MCAYWVTVGPPRFKVNSTLNFGGKFIYHNADKKSMKYEKICVKHINKLVESVIADLPVMFLAQSIVFNEPVYVHHVQHLPITPFAVNLPFFVKESSAEYAVNMIIQTIWGAYAMIGLSSVEVGECLINNTIAAIPDVIKCSLIEFCDEFKSNGINIKSIARLRNTFLQIQDYKR